MSQQSLADQAVDTISAIRRMCANTDQKHPEHYTVRKMKQVAEQIVSNALQQANDLVYAAEILQQDIRKAEAEQRAQPAQKGTP